MQPSPYGRVTEDFHKFVDRLPDRGEPYTPIAFLLNYGHGYERVSNACKMLDVFQESPADVELRELFNVAWYPNAISESKPITPDVQSMPNGVYGNIFDVLVDRPGRGKPIFNYPVLWPTGDVVLDGEWPGLLEDYVNKGGTLVLNVEAVRGRPALAKLLGVKLGDKRKTFEVWSPTGQGAVAQAVTPFEVESVELTTATILATAGQNAPMITRNKVGQGAVILTLVPRMIGLDERAHPALPYLMNGLTQGLLPVEVVAANGQPLSGEISYQINRTKDGYVVGLFNNRGIDKTQHGIARVDRTQIADVVLRVKQPIKSAKEYTQPRDLAVQHEGGGSQITVRVQPGDVQVVGIVTP